MTETQQGSLNVDGEVVLGADVASFDGATVRVLLEDVSRAGGMSRTIAEQIIESVAHESGSERRLGFSLRGHRPDPRATISVRVHVDLNGQGEVEPGDCVTTQAYPVCSGKNSDHVSVAVRQVAPG